MLRDTLRRLENQARAFDYATIKGVEIVDGRVECDVDLALYDASTVAELAGGRAAPFSVPQSGERWLVALLGAGLDDVWLLMPIATADAPESTLDGLDASKVTWRPPNGLDALISPAGGAVSVDSSKEISLTVAGLTFKLTSAGKISLGSNVADVLDLLDQALGFVSATNADLASSQVITLLGPQPLTLAPRFAARVAEVEVAKALLQTIKA